MVNIGRVGKLCVKGNKVSGEELDEKLVIRVREADQINVNPSDNVIIIKEKD